MRSQPVGTLPYGRQRLVEIALALAARPKVLLLDEPAAGVPAAESHLILDAVAALPAEIAVLIVEHDMDVVFRFARRITVLANGAILAEGAPEAIAADERVRAVYLGRRPRWLSAASARARRGHRGLRRHRGPRGARPRARRRASA